MTLPTKRFRKLNEDFTCEHCGREVPAASGGTPRNHCPFCLWCKHVDVNPGDRANPCKGSLRPIGVVSDARKTYVIMHECQRCGERTRARAILDDDVAADDIDLIRELSAKPIENERAGAPKKKKRR